MAYSDYGGFAYRNGQRVLERSDCAIAPDGKMTASPGVYPGFGALAAGRSVAEVQEMTRKATMAHAVLGEPPLLLLLYKQTSARVFLDGREVHRFSPGPAFWERHGRKPAIERTTAKASCIADTPAELDETVFEIVHHDEDGRTAVYARVTTPATADQAPIVWTGWSAYGAGAGLEEDDKYHRGATNTAYHDRKLKELLDCQAGTDAACAKSE